LDTVVAGIFLVLVTLIVLLSLREWILLLAQRRLAVLHETEPVWLPDYALAAEKPTRLFHLFALAFSLARELSGEAELERAHQAAQLQSATAQSSCHESGRIYLQVAEKRFTGVKRCC
jgi:hypothetical protein